MKNKVLLVSIIFLLLISFGFAGDIARQGTSSASELLIPVGARSIAMGGATVSNITGAEAMFYNPAGMAASNKSEVLFNNMNWIGDINLNYLAATFNGESIGTFGLSFKSLDFGDIEETTEDYPDGTGNTYSPSFIIVGLSYSRMLTEKITAGITTKYIHEGILQTEASTIAFDLGVQYSFNNNLRLGVVMKNVGGKMKFAGRNLERTYQISGADINADNGYYEGVALASDVPSLFTFGMAYTVDLNEDNLVNLTGTFSSLNDASDKSNIGLEYSWQNMVFLRGGYNYLSEGQTDNIFGASFGAGIKYQIGDFDVYFDYAYMQMTNYFDANNVFTIKLGL